MAALKMILAAFTMVLLAVWTSGQPLPTKPEKIQRPFPSLVHCPVFSYDAVYDLENNVITSHPKVTLVAALTGTGCSTQGVLKLALASAAEDPSRRRVLVDLFFANRTNWVFNLGDSSTNNGYGGDSGTQKWDAEVHGVGSTFTGYLSDNGGSAQSFHILNLYTTRLTLLVGDGHIVWLSKDNNKYNYYYNSAFFALKGQTDSSGPVNYDLYLGLNRVISSTLRIGTGLCKVGIKFLPEF